MQYVSHKNIKKLSFFSTNLKQGELLASYGKRYFLVHQYIQKYDKISYYFRLEEHIYLTTPAVKEARNLR